MCFSFTKTFVIASVFSSNLTTPLARKPTGAGDLILRERLGIKLKISNDEYRILNDEVILRFEYNN